MVDMIGDPEREGTSTHPRMPPVTIRGVGIDDIIGPTDQSTGQKLIVGEFRGRWMKFRHVGAEIYIPVGECDRWESVRLIEACRSAWIELIRKPGADGAQLVIGWNRRG